jgi:coproporphyrinogen III oxidase
MRIALSKLGAHAARVSAAFAVGAAGFSLAGCSPDSSAVAPLRGGAETLSAASADSCVLAASSAASEPCSFPPPRVEVGSVPPSKRQDEMESLACSVQDSICRALEDLEGPVSQGGARFREDRWERSGGGGGRSRAMQDGRVFEKAGVNVSIVHGMLPAAAAAQMAGGGKKLHAKPGGGGLPFYAVGISLVLHPRNPKAPTAHANYRMFEVKSWDPVEGKEQSSWWYGGGADLTPSFLYEADASHFHGVFKAVCDKHDSSYYPKYKAWCDEYFNNRHQAKPGDDGERRGVGGVFFDDFGATTVELSEAVKQSDAGGGHAFAFVRDAANAFLPAYLPIVAKRCNEAFTEEDKRFQQLRRGRYVEFNLVHDRGTKFGLHTPGSRIESILVSLPLTARWEYDAPEPAAGSNASELMKVLRHPREWA